MQHADNRRILVIDDNPAIHEDFKKTLMDRATETAGFADAESMLFDEAPPSASQSTSEGYDIDYAFQGAEALEKVRAAVARNAPYAMAFVDVRMPPGWDGVETIARMWEVDPQLQAVICTAFADYSWQEMLQRLGRSDRLLILKKPFDPIEVRQLATALTEKWNVSMREKLHLLDVQRAELEARAYASSLETVNHALETSRRFAEADSHAKSQLLLHMAQNLFAPVDAMLGDAERIRDLEASDAAEWLTRVGTLCRDGDQLRRSLQDVLDLSELEADRLHLEIARFSPRELALALVAEHRSKASERGLVLELACAASVPAEISSDRARIRRILAHLVDNAIEHTSEGFVRIAVSMNEPPGWHEPLLCFEVTDSGRGLTREQEASLFEPFCHARDTQVRANGHFGLGLSVSKRLAQRLGGDLCVEHAAGTGCRFVLTLKAAVPTPNGTARSERAS